MSYGSAGVDQRNAPPSPRPFACCRTVQSQKARYVRRRCCRGRSTRYTPGHRTLAEVVATRFGVEVHYELSTANVDKPDLPADEVARRVRQFAAVGTVWVTRAARFVEKAELFPGTAFVLGFDTAVRLIDPKYYGGTEQRDSALDTLRDRGCRLIVGGRLDAAGTFRVWDQTRDQLPGRFDDLFAVLAEDEFRVDLSSTALRAVTSCPSPWSSSPSSRRT